MGTLDAHLVAIDARSGRKVWDIAVDDRQLGYTISAAPLVVNDLVVVGTVVSQEYFGVERDGSRVEARGHIDAYDAKTGSLRWRFFTIPGPGQPGNDTWAHNSWREGRTSAWMTGTYDPTLNVTYWGIGNPAPAFLGRERSGDNLYSSSVVALDADTGELRWHFQFTPHDVHDWDAAQTLVLSKATIAGRERDVLLNANRNGFFYALDRRTGEFLYARPFAQQTWAAGFENSGRPILNGDLAPTAAGTVVAPNADGATSWWSPSLSESTGLFYVTAHDGSETYFDWYTARSARLKGTVSSFIRALDPMNGSIRWEHPLPGRSTAGILTTAGGLLFSADDTGHIFALNADTGQPVWREALGTWIHSAPIAFRAGGESFVSIATNRGVYAFALPTPRHTVVRFGWLQLVGENRATRQQHTNVYNTARINVDRAPTTSPHDIQWNLERFSIREGQAYSVRFRAKADLARIIRVGASTAVGADRDSGLYREVRLTTKWQDYALDFVAARSDPRTRIHFDIGGDSSSVDIERVDLIEHPAIGR